jgi:O-antigen/teichoic acid export membrane protein
MKAIKKIYNHLYSDSLYRNAIYLMLSTCISSLLGFLFWIIYARIFTPNQIGIATTLIAVSLFISNISQLGFNNSLIYYLPKSKDKNKLINATLTTSSTFALLATLVFLGGISFFSPKLLFILNYPFFIIAFIIGTIFLLLNSLSEPIFISYRSTKYIFIKNTVYSLIKISLPILFVAYGSLGLFNSYNISVIVTAVLAFILLYKYFNYRLTFVYSYKLLKMLLRFSVINYFSAIMGMLQTLIIPIMIVNLISPKVAAYYYIVDLFINFLGIVPGVITQALFAEGTHEPNNIKKLILKSALLIFAILIPAIIILVLFGKYLLLAFGKQYSEEGIKFLQIVSFSAIFTSINYLITTILNIKADLKKILFMSIFGSLLMILLTYLFIPYGLVGVGYGILISEAATCILYILVTIKTLL